VTGRFQGRRDGNFAIFRFDGPPLSCHLRRLHERDFMPDSLLLIGYAPTYGSLADPAGSGVIVAAVQWLEGTLLGTVATSVAVIAVSTIGFMMLAGRVSIRHGLTVVIGCFILFGASSIVAGIQSVAGMGVGTPSYASRGELEPAPAPAPVEYPLANNDPYAGASVPTGR
jgi:type IV secretion system protein VirB2